MEFNIFQTQKIIGEQNQLPITFSTALVCNKILKVKNLTTTHTNFKPFKILSHIQLELKVI